MLRTIPHFSGAIPSKHGRQAQLRPQEPIQAEQHQTAQQQLEYDPDHLDREINRDHRHGDANPAHDAPPGAWSKTMLQQVVAPSAFCNSDRSTATTSSPASCRRWRVRGKLAGWTTDVPTRNAFAACSSSGSTWMSRSPSNTPRSIQSGCTSNVLSATSVAADLRCRQLCV